MDYSSMYGGQLHHEHQRAIEDVEFWSRAIESLRNSTEAIIPDKEGTLKMYESCLQEAQTTLDAINVEMEKRYPSSSNANRRL